MLKGLRPSRLTRNGFTALHLAAYKVKSIKQLQNTDVSVCFKVQSMSLSLLTLCVSCGRELSKVLPHGGVQVHTKAVWLAACLNRFITTVEAVRAELTSVSH